MGQASLPWEGLTGGNYHRDAIWKEAIGPTILMTVASIICYDKLCLSVGSNTKYFARLGLVVVVEVPICLAFFVLEPNTYAVERGCEVIRRDRCPVGCYICMS